MLETLFMQPTLFAAVLMSVAMCSSPAPPPRSLGTPEECKAGLIEVFAAEKAWYEAGKQYSEHPKQIGFNPPPGKNLYMLNAAGAMGIAARVTGPVGISGKCPACNITIVCTCNLDADPDEDVWSISTTQRVTLKGMTIPAGEAFH